MSVSAPANDPPLKAAEPRSASGAGVATPTAANHASRSSRLGLGALSVYGSGALVENITTWVVGSLLLFYLTIICGLSGSEAGAALGITLVVDSVIDPVVGSISDNSRSRHGRRHPLMLASIIPIVVAFGLLFSVPRGLSGLPLFAYALATLLSLRVAISFFYVPYMALGAELTDDYAERSTVVAGRVFFTVLGGLTAAFLTWGVFLKGPRGRYDAAAYSPLAWTFGAIVAFGALLSTLGTLRARGRLHAAPEGRRFGLGQFFAEVIEVLRNRSFVSLFLPCLILFTALGVAGALTLHANTFFWKLSSPQILILGLLLPVGVFGGIFAAGMLARAIEKRSAAMLGLAMIGLSQLGPVTLRLTGVIPAAAALPTLGAAVVIGGIGAGIATIAFQSMMADATDEHEHLFGARREGLYFAGITLSAKASSGLGAWIGGITLDLIGFPHGIAATPALLATIPAATIRNLGIAYGPGASIFTAVAVAVLFGYKLNKTGHTRILEELNRRRAEKTAG
jgi:GPH family glycoside/pentoside/hexuronide:cation symporter